MHTDVSVSRVKGECFRDSTEQSSTTPPIQRWTDANNFNHDRVQEEMIPKIRPEEIIHTHLLSLLSCSLFGKSLLFSQHPHYKQ